MFNEGFLKDYCMKHFIPYDIRKKENKKNIKVTIVEDCIDSISVMVSYDSTKKHDRIINYFNISKEKLKIFNIEKRNEFIIEQRLDKINKIKCLMKNN